MTAARPSHRIHRSAARLRAVQALYQRAMAGTPLPRLMAEFHDHRLQDASDEQAIATAEADFFDDVVAGVAARESELDALVATYLAAGWTLERLDPLLRQLLRAGAYELLARPDVPRAAVISAYVDVAHAFYPPAEAGFVNALLDRVARAVRGEATGR
ncbi:MAG: transcription antitermination factor NusB [Sphingomonadaceae bacterium]